MNKVNSQQMEK